MVNNAIGETAGFSQLSNNIVEIMNILGTNKGIRHLLYIDDHQPFHEKHNSEIPTKDEILSISSEKRRIRPVSFNPEATVDDRTEIRVYYNIGRLDSSGKQVDANMHIDIICAKDLWLIQGVNNKSLIRPYEIMSRIADEIGAGNRNGINIGSISQFQMLSVNERFDALRIYYNTKDISGNINHLGMN